jgi:AAA domain
MVALKAAEDAATSGDFTAYRIALGQAHNLVTLQASTGAGLVLGAVAVTGGELFAPLGAAPWLVRDLQWGPGRPSSLLGYGASGKTLAAQSASVSLVTGRAVWGWFRPARRGVRVLHLDGEQGKRATVRRYQRLAFGMGLDEEERAALAAGLAVSVYPRVRLTTPGAQEHYRRAVEGYDLCIIDSLRWATAGLDENDSKIREPLDMFGPISEASGCMFLVIHHAGKAPVGGERDAREAGRGSSAIFDASGSTLHLAAEQDASGQVTRKVRMTKSSADAEGMLAEPFYLAIIDVAEGQDPAAGVRVEYRTEEQVKGTAPTLAAVNRDLDDRIRAVVAAMPGCSAAHVTRNVTGNAKGIATALADLVGRGVLLRSAAARGACAGLRVAHPIQGDE